MGMNEPKDPISERRVAAWLGKALRVEGKIISREDLTIDGEIEGAIEVGDHDLVIGPGAAVKADLRAKTITISGTVTGDVQAVEKIDLRASGWVQGNLVAPRLAMAEGATVTGKVKAGA
jgi:cytoskeletal protein CcmA (bactofilin family)